MQLGVQLGELRAQLERALRDEPEPTPLEVRPQLEHLGEHLERRGLPSSRTTRVYWFSISHRPSRIWVRSMAIACSTSSGSNPAVTSGLPYFSGTNRYGRLPMTVDTWPGPRNPSRRRSGDSRIALIGGTIVTWLQNTRKLRTPSLARLQQRQRRRWRGRLEADGEEHHVAVRVLDRHPQRVERRVHHPHVGAARLRLEQVPVSSGTRIMSPKLVKMTPGVSATAMASSIRPIGITHTGQPGPCTSSTVSGRTCSMPCR